MLIFTEDRAALITSATKKPAEAYASAGFTAGGQGPASLFFEQRIYEGVPVEELQIRHLLPYPDVAHRHLQLI
ncbi:hypothetical protein GCM10027175_08880 [Hymenobacter latericoloratus]